MACPPAPLIKLSIADKIIILFFRLILQTAISQRFILITFSVLIFLFSLAILIKEFFVKIH